jgi:hypothetical protein
MEEVIAGDGGLAPSEAGALRRSILHSAGLYKLVP